MNPSSVHPSLRCVIRPLLASLLFAFVQSSPADWLQFRGPNGTGIAPDDAKLPTTWSDSEHLKWKADLPGPGASCPIVTGNRVLVTYWSGYGTEGPESGEMSALELHLICLDRNSGRTLWDRSVKARLPELEYSGMLAQHGYASHTPVTDGRTVYAFFGKSGVHAFDLEGKALWSAEVGDGLDGRKWGSAASPVLVGDMLIVTASPESGAVYGFDKKSGRQLWKYASGELGGIWATPVLSGEDIVLSAPKRIVALNPKTGEERWTAEGLKADAITGSLVVGGGNLFGMGARGAGSLSVHAHGSEAHVEWTGRDGASVLSPIYHDNHLYWISGDLAHCRDARTGESVYSERLPGEETPPPSSGGQEDWRARFASMDYASPVAANGLLYHTRRKGEVVVVKLQPQFEIVARNRFASDSSDFSATPAISDGQLFLRSAKALYCVAN